MGRLKEYGLIGKHSLSVSPVPELTVSVSREPAFKALPARFLKCGLGSSHTGESQSSIF